MLRLLVFVLALPACGQPTIDCDAVRASLARLPTTELLPEDGVVDVATSEAGIVVAVNDGGTGEIVFHDAGVRSIGPRLAGIVPLGSDVLAVGESLGARLVSTTTEASLLNDSSEESTAVDAIDGNFGSVVIVAFQRQRGTRVLQIKQANATTPTELPLAAGWTVLSATSLQERVCFLETKNSELAFRIRCLTPDATFDVAESDAPSGFTGPSSISQRSIALSADRVFWRTARGKVLSFALDGSDTMARDEALEARRLYSFECGVLAQRTRVTDGLSLFGRGDRLEIKIESTGPIHMTPSSLSYVANGRAAVHRL